MLFNKSRFLILQSFSKLLKYLDATDLHEDKSGFLLQEQIFSFICDDGQVFTLPAESYIVFIFVVRYLLSYFPLLTHPAL